MRLNEGWYPKQDAYPMTPIGQTTHTDPNILCRDWRINIACMEGRASGEGGRGYRCFEFSWGIW